MRFNFLPTCLAAVALAAFVTGCGDSAKKGFKEVPKGTKVVDTSHEHHHEHGPHGGHIIELGEEEYHAEVAVSGAKSKTLHVYLLGPDGKKPQTTDQKEVTLNLTVEKKPVQLKLAAAPLKGEPEGQSSHFEAAVSDEIGPHVRDIEALKGRLVATIGGKQYTADLAHDHDHDDHDHEKESKEKK
jgi:hypothetical protein